MSDELFCKYLVTELKLMFPHVPMSFLFRLGLVLMTKMPPEIRKTMEDRYNRGRQ